MAPAHGGGNFSGGWMKNPESAMISCDDGFRTVTYLLEALDDDADVMYTQLRNNIATIVPAAQNTEHAEARRHGEF